MTWYKKAFGSAYLEIYSHRDVREARRALELIERKVPPLRTGRESRNIRVLDLCCGPGRYSRLLAADGYEVVGLDLSAELLGEALRRRETESERSQSLWYVRADMREVPFAGVFDLVINMFTSFGYFMADAENLRVLEAIRQALKPGGRYLIDYLNRPQVVSSLVPEDSYLIEGLRVIQRRKISPDNLRVEKTIRVEAPGGHTDTWRESVRLYSRAELEEMLRRSRLGVDSVMGDYDGSPYAENSARLILTGSTLE